MSHDSLLSQTPEQHPSHDAPLSLTHNNNSFWATLHITAVPQRVNWASTAEPSQVFSLWLCHLIKVANSPGGPSKEHTVCVCETMREGKGEAEVVKLWENLLTVCWDGEVELRNKLKIDSWDLLTESKHLQIDVSYVCLPSVNVVCRYLWMHQSPSYQSLPLFSFISSSVHTFLCVAACGWGNG